MPESQDSIKLRYSTVLAKDKIKCSGKAEKDPGSPQRGSCRCHHPSSGLGVDPSRIKYDTRVSDAAAHSKGIAANPRGVNNNVPPLDSPSSPPFLRLSLGVLVGVLLGAVPYVATCRSASARYPFIASCCVNPLLLFHALILARSAGVSEDGGGSFNGASPDTACLCRPYSSRRSRLEGQLAGFQFFMKVTLALKDAAIVLLSRLGLEVVMVVRYC